MTFFFGIAHLLFYCGHYADIHNIYYAFVRQIADVFEHQ
jgi:hypothetical protein